MTRPRRHLVTFLGTGAYQATSYYFPTDPERAVETPYVARALAELLDADAVTVVATADAEARHGEELRRALGDRRTVNFERIPEGRNEGELERQFEVLASAMSKPCSELCVDITHGFRSQPLLAGTVLAYLRLAGTFDGCTERVFYGRFLPDEPDRSPIWELSWLLRLVDWSEGAALFVRAGDATALAGMFEETEEEARAAVWRAAALAGKERPEKIPRTRRAATALKEFAQDYAAVRVGSIISGEPGGNGTGSAARLAEELRKVRDQIDWLMPTAVPVYERIERAVDGLAAPTLASREGLQAMVNLARKYLEQGRLLESVAVAREGLVTLHVLNRGGDRTAIFDKDVARKRGESDWYAEEALEGQGHNTRADVRNDLLHAGFRSQPLSGDALYAQVKELVDHFGRRVEAWSPPAGERPDGAQKGRTIVVTRHPGARSWIERRGIEVDRTVEHLDLAEVSRGDTVIGTLPVHLAGQVCARGARYVHLALDLPPPARGNELTADELDAYGARLETYEVRRSADDDA